MKQMTTSIQLFVYSPYATVGHLQALIISCKALGGLRGPILCRGAGVNSALCCDRQQCVWQKHGEHKEFFPATLCS